MTTVELTSESAEQTARAAESIARGLSEGDLVFVSGEVGTGKTTFVRAACTALGVRDNVTSPSFTIGRTYRGRLPVSHLDLFRLETLEGEDPALLADYLTPGSVAFVEWPRAIAPDVDPDRVALRVRFEHLGGDRRLLRISGRRELLRSAESALELPT